MKKLIVQFVILVVFTIPGFSQAEDVHTDKYEIETLDEVVVTATKTEEKRKDIPNSVIIVDDVEIDESPAKTLGELLANKPGLDWRTYGDYGGASGEIHIRGMSGKATQIRVNGVSINSPSLGVADVSRIPLNSIDRIEIVKGSGSVLYGSGAMAGTINIITKRPKRELMNLKIKGGYGTQDSYLLSAEQGMFAIGDFGYYVTANRYQTDGFRENSDLTHTDVSMKLVLDKGKALDISLYGDYIDRDYGRPGVKPPEGTQSYFINGEEFFNSESASLLDRAKDNDAHLILNVKSQPADWVDFKVRGDYTYMENYGYNRYHFDGSGLKTWVTNRVFGAEGDANIRPFEGASVLLGIEYKNYDWENKNIDLDTNGSDIPGSTLTTTANLHTTGTYAEAQYRPWKYVKGLVGIRHEDNSQFGTEDLPRFGLIINPLENTALKLNYGKHFFAPTPNDLYWPQGLYTKGNPNLQPETGWHSDATLEQELLDDLLFFTLSYFNWTLDNKIQWAPDINWVWTPQNLDQSKGSGWEIGTTVGPFYNLTLSLDYTYIDAQEKNQYVTRREAYTPRQLFRGDLSYWTDFGLTATATVRYVGDRVFYGTDKTITEPTNTLASYWTADLRLEQRLFDHWLFSLQASNLFDKDYDTHFGSFTDPTTWQTSTAAFPGAGRSVFFGVSYEF